MTKIERAISARSSVEIYAARSIVSVHPGDAILFTHLGQASEDSLSNGRLIFITLLEEYLADRKPHPVRYLERSPLASRSARPVRHGKNYAGQNVRAAVRRV